MISSVSNRITSDGLSPIKQWTNSRSFGITSDVGALRWRCNLRRFLFVVNTVGILQGLRVFPIQVLGKHQGELKIRIVIQRTRVESFVIFFFEFKWHFLIVLRVINLSYFVVKKRIKVFFIIVCSQLFSN